MCSLDVFSCIGCHAIGFERAGIETTAFCEINSFRRTELAKRFPGKHIYEDIREPGVYHSVGANIVIGGPPWEQNGLSWSSPLEMRRGKPKSVTIFPELIVSMSGALNLALATLVRRIFAGEYSWLPAPACRDWRSPGLRSHPRLSASRGQQMPEVIGTRISSQLYRWMLGLPESAENPGKN